MEHLESTTSSKSSTSLNIRITSGSQDRDENSSATSLRSRGGGASSSAVVATSPLPSRGGGVTSIALRRRLHLCRAAVHCKLLRCGCVFIFAKSRWCLWCCCGQLWASCVFGVRLMRGRCMSLQRRRHRSTPGTNSSGNMEGKAYQSNPWPNCVNTPNQTVVCLEPGANIGNFPVR